MESQSPYLQAIQAIPGSVPGEKYRWLNTIAKEATAGGKGQGDSTVGPRVDNVPAPLLPLVRLEIANVLRQHDDVVEALKSEDGVVVSRALSLRWFFRGDNRRIVSVEYFEKNLLPYVSLDTRIQLVKRLAINLRTAGQKKIAEEFYTYFARKYGREQAEPLFVACSESFVYDTIKANKIILSCRTVQNLFVDYPDLIIRYLKTPWNEEGPPASNDVDLSDYSNFLPRLIKNHSATFVELLERNVDYTYGIRLSNKAAETFLKSNVEALLRKPKLYTQIIPLKVIAAKLTKSQYKCMLGKLFPEKWQRFGYYAIKDYLQYYPEQERLTLVTDLYREVYKKNFLDNTDAMDEHFLCMLPTDERIRQARKKLEKEPDWRERRYDTEKAWRCYLPTEESIPSIKTEISKTSASDFRAALLYQMFYSCKINDDKDALLEALRYFAARHKNEQTYVWYEVMQRLTKYFDLATLSKDHWAVLDDLIQFLHVKDQLRSNGRSDIPKEILVAGVHYSLIHDLPIEDKITLIVEINMKSWKASWTTLEKYPEYDRRCFEMYMSVIPKKYPKGDKIWEDLVMDSHVIEMIVTAMYEFNTRNAKNSKIDKLSIRNYPWLLDAVEAIVKTTDKDMKWKANVIMDILKIHEKDLYNAWHVKDENAVANVESGAALVRLAKDPKHILDNWEEYLKMARSAVSHVRAAQRFIRATRWHQDIPIKFADSCCSKLAADKDVEVPNSIIVLGILMDGEEFARVIEPFVPTDSKIDIKTETAKSTYGLVSAIPQAMNLTNPPVPLSLVLPFCDGDYLQLGLASLTNVSRRTSVEKIQRFAKILADRRVSVKKHGIRLFCLVSSIDDFRDFLSNLWNTEKHRSIRAVIFGKIHDLFFDEPSPDTWIIVKNCMTDLQLDDDDILKILMDFNGLDEIPDKYIVDYITQLLATIEKLPEKGLSAKLTAEHISTILRNIRGSISNEMPEDFCEQLLRKYFCNPSVHTNVSVAGKQFAEHGYLETAGDKLESRLAVLCNLFEDRLKNHWNIPHPEDPLFFPINYMAHDFMTDLVYLKGDDSHARSKIMESVLKSFLAVLKPECDAVSYAKLTFGIALKDAKTETEIVAKICETLPRLVAAISPEYVVFLSDTVKSWLNILVDKDKLDSVMLDLTECLCKMGTDHACLLAARFLDIVKSEEFNDRRVKILELLRKSKHPTVLSLVYLQMNTRVYSK